MNRQQIWSTVTACVIAMLFFSAVMALGIGLVVLNERSAPDFPWFPIPIIGLLIAAIVDRFPARSRGPRSQPCPEGCATM